MNKNTAHGGQKLPDCTRHSDFMRMSMPRIHWQLIPLALGAALWWLVLNHGEHSSRIKYSNAAQHDHSPYSFASLYEQSPRTWEVPRNTSASLAWNEDDRTDPAALTIVLALPSRAEADLQALLSLLLHAPLRPEEILIACARDALSDARSVLRAIFTRESLAAHDHPEVVLIPWPAGMAPDDGLAHVAASAQAARLLLLDGTGLDGIAPRARDLLLRPPAVPLPFGPRGVSIRFASAKAECLSPADSVQSASFLLPPFVMSSEQLRAGLARHRGDQSTWQALGDFVASSRLDRVGGVVLPGMRTDSLNVVWCSPTLLHDAVQHATSVSHDPSLSMDAPGDKGRVRQPASFVPLVQGGAGAILLLFRDRRALSHFSTAACRLQGAGYSLHALLHAENERRVWEAGQLGDCSITYQALSGLRSPTFAEDEAAYLALISSSDVIIGEADHLPTSLLLEALLLKIDGPRPTVIRLPHADLPFTDWMGALSITELRNWHTPKVDISVITNDRPRSLARLLSSLTTARFFGDSLSVRLNLEQTADEQTVQVVNDFAWLPGQVFIHRRIVHGGLLPAVVESWYPRSNDSYGLLLEDDVELSPLFYAWAKMAVLRYRYGASSNRSPQLFGVSLYQQKNTELRPTGRRSFSARAVFAAEGLPDPSTPYLSQVPCSWGALYFPEQWREFHDFLALRLSAASPFSTLPADIVPHARSNLWTHSWKRYFIELVYLRGYVMLYPNYARFAALATNHLEPGAHVRDQPQAEYVEKRKLFVVPLMALPALSSEEEDTVTATAPATGLLELPQQALPPWDALPVVDLLGLLASMDTTAQRGRRRREDFSNCELDRDSALHDARTLFCLRAP